MAFGQTWKASSTIKTDKGYKNLSYKANCASMPKFEFQISPGCFCAIYNLKNHRQKEKDEK